MNPTQDKKRRWDLVITVVNLRFPTVSFSQVAFSSWIWGGGRSVAMASFKVLSPYCSVSFAWLGDNTVMIIAGFSDVSEVLMPPSVRLTVRAVHSPGLLVCGFSWLRRGFDFCLFHVGFVSLLSWNFCCVLAVVLPSTLPVNFHSSAMYTVRPWCWQNKRAVSNC